MQRLHPRPDNNRSLRRPFLRRLMPPVLLVLAIFATFWPVLRNDFVNWDDAAEIYQNPDLNPVTWHSLMWNWSHTRMSLYMPLTYMTWGAVAAAAPRGAAGQLSPVPFHALNLLLHCICTLLVYGLLRKLGARAGASFAASLLFAVHPVQVEAIAWASGMYTLLSTALALAAVWMFIDFRTAISRARRAAEYAGGMVTLAAALLVKAAAAATALMCAAIDLTLLQQSIRRSFIALLPWALLALPAVWAAKHFQDMTNVPAPPWWGRPLVAADSLGFYALKILFPLHLCPDYGRTPTWVMAHLSLAWPMILIGSAMLAVVLILHRHMPWLAGGLGVLIAGVLPYSGITTFDFQYVSTVTDRYAYGGMAGVAMLAAAAARWLPARVLLIAICAALACLSNAQTRRWHDTQRLFDYTLSVNPRSLIAQNILGYLAAQSGRRGEAEQRYEAALRIWPADATIHYDLANLYAADGRLADASQQYALAVRYQPHDPAYHNNWGIALARSGQWPAAQQQFEAAIQINPHDADAHCNLAYALAAQGRVQEAKQQYQLALQIDPQSQRARRGLGTLGPAGRP